MKTAKKVLIVLGILIAIPLLLALFTRKEYSVERSISIHKPKQEVFEYIKLVKNQEHYSTWVQQDPEMKKEYRGTDGTVGFVSAWDSKMDDVGKGEQEIKKINDGERIDFELRFIKPFEGISNADMRTEADGENQTNVKWSFNSKMPYPMNIMLLFLNMDEMLGKDLQKSLENLKTELEKNQISATHTQ